MITIDNITRSFDDRVILDQVSAEIAKGEIFTIIGPSGQGKSTLLRLLNLLDTPTSGDIRINNLSIFEKSNSLSMRRKMGMVFQHPIAFHETVYENIAIGLRYRKIPEKEIRKRIREKLEEIDLVGYEKRKAVTLSGGEKQRVALARIIVTEPEILILDEPTANLDPISTERIEAVVREYNRRDNMTVLMATHDLLEGQRLSDRIAVMMHGHLIQTGDPFEIFSSPCSAEVARFIGIRNIMTGKIISNTEGIAHIRISGLIFSSISDLPVGTPVTCAIRPEEITIHTTSDLKVSARNIFKGVIKEIKAFGVISLVFVDCSGVEIAAQITVQAMRELQIAPGSYVSLSFKAPSVHIMKDQCD